MGGCGNWTGQIADCCVGWLPALQLVALTVSSQSLETAGAESKREEILIHPILGAARDASTNRKTQDPSEATLLSLEDCRIPSTELFLMLKPKQQAAGPTA